MVHCWRRAAEASKRGREKKRSVGVIQSNNSLQSSAWGGGRAVVNRHVDMSVQSWTTFSLALARLAIPGPHITVAAESSAFSGGVARFANHRQPQMLGLVHQKAWPFKRRGPLSTFLAATAFRNFRQPSSASLVVETDHRDPLTHHSAYGFPQVENFFLPLRDSRPQPRPDATLRITAP